MVQGKWIRPPSKKGRFGASVVFYPLAFSNLFRIASNRSSPHPGPLEGLINGDDGKVVGMELLYDALQKSHAFFIVIIAFYDGHFKDEAAVILRPEGFHIGSILLQGITGKGPLTFFGNRHPQHS